MRDDRTTLDPEQEQPEGEHRHADAEDPALEDEDAEEVKGGGWPPLSSSQGGSSGGPL
jgi:hypothetical protein